MTNTSSIYAPTLLQNQIVQPNIVRLTNYSIKFNGNGADVNRIRIPLEDGASTQYPINVGATHFTTKGWIRANYSENTTTATDEDARYSNIIYDRDSWGEQRGHVWGVTRSGSNLVACFGHAGSGGSWNTIFTTSNIGDGEWHHIAVTRNQTTGVVKIWIDVVEEASGTYDTTNWSFPAGHTVGSGQDNEYLVLGTEKHDVGYYYTGELDEFRVSNEVKYTSTFTPSRQLPNDDGVVGLYRCDEGSGTVFFDETLNTNGELLVGGSPSGPIWINLENSYNLFFAPTVDVGEITLLPNLLVYTNTFHAPTITTGAVCVNPNFLTSTNTFYNPTISVGSVSVEPNLLENINTISEPTISVGVVTVSPNVLVNTSVVQEPTINVGAVAVSPNVLTNTNVFYNPTVSSGYVISPDLLENTSVVHEPTINPGSVSVATNTQENTTIFYNPIVFSEYTIRYRIVIPDLINNVGLKIFLPALILAIYLGIVSKGVFVPIILIYFFIVSIALLVYLLRLDTHDWKPGVMASGRGKFRELIGFMFFSVLNGLGAGLALRIDTVMVSAMISVEAVTIYAIIMTISNVMEIPNKAINQIAGPVISASWQNGNRENLNEVYRKSSLYGLLAGMWLFLVLYFIWPDILALMPGKLNVDLNTVLLIFTFLGMARIIDLMTGVNSVIISYSDEYRFHMYFLLVLGFTNVMLNYFLLKSMGLPGAALATLLSYFVFNLLKYVFVRSRFRMTLVWTSLNRIPINLWIQNRCTRELCIRIDLKCSRHQSGHAHK